MRNLYEVLGIANYSSIEDVIKAYDAKKKLFLQNPKPTDEEQLEFEKVNNAFFTLSLEEAKNKHDAELSSLISSNHEAFTSTKKGSTAKPQSKQGFTVLILGVVIAYSAYYFVSKNNAEKTLNEPLQASLTEPQKQVQAQAQQKAEDFIPPFLVEFDSLSQSQRAASLYKGLLGDGVENTSHYPESFFMQELSTTAEGVPFPPYTGIIPNTPAYLFGDAKIILSNPTDQDAYVKVLFLDEGENHVVREVYLQARTQFKVSGLPEGKIQLATIFPKYPQYAFLSYHDEVYQSIENTLPIYGSKVNPQTVF